MAEQTRRVGLLKAVGHAGLRRRRIARRKRDAGARGRRRVCFGGARGSDLASPGDGCWVPASPSLTIRRRLCDRHRITRGRGLDPGTGRPGSPHKHAARPAQPAPPPRPPHRRFCFGPLPVPLPWPSARRPPRSQNLLTAASLTITVTMVVTALHRAAAARESPGPCRGRLLSPAPRSTRARTTSSSW